MYFWLQHFPLGLVYSGGWIAACSEQVGRVRLHVAMCVPRASFLTQIMHSQCPGETFTFKTQPNNVTVTNSVHYVLSHIAHFKLTLQSRHHVSWRQNVIVTVGRIVLKPSHFVQLSNFMFLSQSSCHRFFYLLRCYLCLTDQASVSSVRVSEPKRSKYCNCFRHLT